MVQRPRPDLRGGCAAMRIPTVYIFRGRRGDLVKILWHDGVGISLYAKRLERGRFLWPTTSGGAVSISAAQLGYLLEGIDWRNPVRSWRPSRAG